MAVQRDLRPTAFALLFVAIALQGFGASCALDREIPPAVTTTSTPEHAVLIEFSHGSTDLSALFALEEQLEAAVVSVGELEGNEIAADGSDGTLFLSGPDADALWKAIEPAVRAEGFMRKATVRLRYGPPEDAGAREQVLRLP